MPIKRHPPAPLRSKPKLKVRYVNVVNAGTISGNSYIMPGGTINEGVISRLFDIMFRFPKFGLSHMRIMPAPPAPGALPTLRALPAPVRTLREPKLSCFLVAGGLVAAFALGYASACAYNKAQKRVGGLTEEPPVSVSK